MFAIYNCETLHFTESETEPLHQASSGPWNTRHKVTTFGINLSMIGNGDYTVTITESNGLIDNVSINPPIGVEPTSDVKTRLSDFRITYNTTNASYTFTRIRPQKYVTFENSVKTPCILTTIKPRYLLKNGIENGIEGAFDLDCATIGVELHDGEARDQFSVYVVYYDGKLETIYMQPDVDYDDWTHDYFAGVGLDDDQSPAVLCEKERNFIFGDEFRVNHTKTTCIINGYDRTICHRFVFTRIDHASVARDISQINNLFNDTDVVAFKDHKWAAIPAGAFYYDQCPTELCLWADDSIPIKTPGIYYTNDAKLHRLFNDKSNRKMLFDYICSSHFVYC